MNVEAERDDPTSMLTLYRRLIELRRTTPALAVGAYRTAFVEPEVLAYWREHAGVRVLVVLNFGHAAQRVRLEAGGSVLLSTQLDRTGDVDDEFELRADEGVVIALK